MKDDPFKPYKAIAASVAATATAVLTTAVGLPTWAVLTLTVVAAGAGAFAKSNPKVSQ